MSALFQRIKPIEFAAPLKKEEYPLKRLLPLGLFLLDNIRFPYQNRFSRTTVWRLSELYDPANLSYYLRIHWANKLVYFLTGLALVFFLGAVSGSFDAVLALFGLILSALMFSLPDYELKKRVTTRRLLLQLEFPDFLNKLALLIGAGMTVHSAWEKIVRDSTKDTPLYRELKKSLVEIEAGKPILQSYEDFARRCRIPEITKFVTVIIQNVKKGNAELISILNIQANESWELRKNAVKRLGEEAATKLLFPMALMLLAILLIAAAPAILAIQGM